MKIKRRKVFPVPPWIRALEDESGWNIVGPARSGYKFLEDDVLNGHFPTMDEALSGFGDSPYELYMDDYWSIYSRDVWNAQPILEAMVFLLEGWMWDDRMKGRWATGVPNPPSTYAAAGVRFPMAFPEIVPGPAQWVGNPRPRRRKKKRRK